jgi:hypothetical protein
LTLQLAKSGVAIARHRRRRAEADGRTNSDQCGLV